MDIKNIEFDQYIDDEYFISERFYLGNSDIIDVANDIDAHVSLSPFFSTS